MQKEIEALLEAVSALPANRQRRIIAIDGRCAAGKTTLAAGLQARIDCAVFHMDDYFLRPDQRTARRLNTPGGNVDYERFLREILLPLRTDAQWITYRPFDCKSQSLKPAVTVSARPVNIVEGAYSCHPALWQMYDLRVFLSVSADTQKARLLQRNGETGAAAFQERWIPLEEQYFSAYRVPQRCDLRMETDAQ